MTFNELKAERINLGLTLREVASEMGISYETLRKIERGEWRPTPRIGKLVADFYGVKVTDLWPIESPSPLATSPQVATVAAKPPTAATPPGAPDPAQRAPGTPTSQSRHEQRLDWTADSQTEVEEECA